MIAARANHVMVPFDQLKYQEEESEPADNENLERPFSAQKAELQEALHKLKMLIAEKGMDTPYPREDDKYGLLLIRGYYRKVKHNYDIEKIGMISVQKYHIAYRRMGLSKKMRKNWTKEDIIIMVWVIDQQKRDVDTFVHLNLLEVPRDWEHVASYIPGKNPQQAMFKWFYLLDGFTGKEDAPIWSKKEDQIISRLASNGQNTHWQSISRQLYYQTKTYRPSKHCRERWMCFLDPTRLKSCWSPSEDLVLVKEIQQLGKKWSKISKQLKGRSQNAIKNRYIWLVKKYKKAGKHRNEEEILEAACSDLEIASLISTTKQESSFHAVEEAFPIPTPPFYSPSLKIDENPRLDSQVHLLLNIKPNEHCQLPLERHHENQSSQLVVNTSELRFFCLAPVTSYHYSFMISPAPTPFTFVQQAPPLFATHIVPFPFRGRE